MTWQRARTTEHKTERIAAILDAAQSLYADREFDAVTISGIAKQANLGKATVYQYFETKEDVFLALYQADAEAWAGDLMGRLRRMRKPTTARVAAAFADSLRANERLCKLSMLLTPVLERNLGVDRVAEFKLSLLGPTSELMEALLEALPKMAEGDALDLLYQNHAIIAGLWPMAHPSAAADEAMKLPELQHLRIEFYPLYQRTIERLLSGPR